MDDATVERIAEKAAEVAIRRVLPSLGIDVEHIHETQADMIFLHSFRKGMKRLQVAALTAGISGIIYYFTHNNSGS